MISATFESVAFTETGAAASVVWVDQIAGAVTIELQGVDYEVRFHHFSRDAAGNLRVDTADACRLTP